MIYMIAGSLFIPSFGTSCWLSTQAALARSGLRFRKANIARLEAVFLLGPGIHGYLDQLCEQVQAGVLDNMAACESMKRDHGPMNDPQVRRELAERELRLNSARRDILDRHFKELPQQFARFLKLTDFSD